MYDMYPSSWRVVDESEHSTRRNGQGVNGTRRRRRTDRNPDQEAVQMAMNRRDNGGEPLQ
jgi:hypothetical protein